MYWPFLCIFAWWMAEPGPSLSWCTMAGWPRGHPWIWLEMHPIFWKKDGMRIIDMIHKDVVTAMPGVQLVLTSMAGDFDPILSVRIYTIKSGQLQCTCVHYKKLMTISGFSQAVTWKSSDFCKQSRSNSKPIQDPSPVMGVSTLGIQVTTPCSCRTLYYK